MKVFMKLLCLTLLIIVFVFKANSQFYPYIFGDAAGSVTSGTGTSITNFPAPTLGTLFYGFSSADTQSLISTVNPGLLNLGYGSELKMSAGRSGKFSKWGVMGYATANIKFSYTTFEAVFGGNTGKNTCSSGTFYFFSGEGGTSGQFMYNNTMSYRKVQAGGIFRFVFGSSGALQMDRWDSSANSWYSISTLAQATKYFFEFYVSIDTKTSDYTRYGTTYYVARETMDVWINGTLICDDVKSSNVADPSKGLNKLDSYCFYGEGNTSAYIFVDNINYGISANTIYYFYPSISYDAFNTGNWWTIHGGTGSHPSNFTNNYCTYIIPDAHAVTLSAAWTVSGIGSTVIVGDETYSGSCSLTVPSSLTFAGIVDVKNLATLRIQSTTNPTLNNLYTGSTVEYNGSYGQTMAQKAYYNLKINNTAGVTTNSLTNEVAGTLTLTEGTLTDASNTIVMGNGTTIVRTAGILTTAPTFGTTVNVTYDGSGNITTSYELPTSTTVLYNLSATNSANVTLNADATANNNFSIGSGATFNIPETKTLTVLGTPSNAGSNTNFVIKSSGSGTGNFICSTGLAGTVQRYIPISSYSPYHYVSSPIYNSAFSNIWSSGDYNVYYYDETVVNADLDIGWTRITGGTLENCKGYAAVARTASASYSFAGTLNAASLTPTVYYTATTNPGSWPKGIDPRGWNLIGNPFPCALAIKGGSGFLDDNSAKLDASYLAVYFWDDQLGSLTRADYASHNLSGGTAQSHDGGTQPVNIIAVGQGFFIKLIDNGGGATYSTTLAFNHSQKVANSSTQFFIPDPFEIKRFWLGVTGKDDLFNEILLGFLPEATKEFDPGYDAVKLKGNPNIALYSILENRDLIIQGLPAISEELIVPIGMDVKNSGELTLFVNQKVNFNNEQIFLLDKKLNKLINLNNDTSYTFFTSAGTIKDRFELIFAPEDVSSEPANILNPEVNLFLNGRYINIEKLDGKDFNIDIFDILGKKIESRKLSGIGITTINIQEPDGIYFVKITGENINLTRKFFVK